MDEQINVTLSGVDPKVVHIHITNYADNAEVLARLESMEITMSELSQASADLANAVAGAVARIDEDVDHLNDLLEQALAAETADEATITQLREEAAAVTNQLKASTAMLGSIDPDASFPTPVPTEPNPGDQTSPDANPPETPPVETGPETPVEVPADPANFPE